MKTKKLIDYPLIIHKKLILFLLLMTFVSIDSYAKEALLYAENASKTIIIEGETLLEAFHLCKDCDYIPQICEDIDGDGLIESLLLTDNGDGIQIEFNKINTQGESLYYEVLSMDFESKESKVYNTQFNIILTDLDSDRKNELIIAYDNESEGLSGHVYKFNGGNINFEELLNLIGQSGIKVSNVIQDTGKFSGGWNDSTSSIDGDTINLQVSPRGNVYVMYLYRNGKLYRLED